MIRRDLSTCTGYSDKISKQRERERKREKVRTREETELSSGRDRGAPRGERFDGLRYHRVELRRIRELCSLARDDDHGVNTRTRLFFFRPDKRNSDERARSPGDECKQRRGYIPERRPLFFTARRNVVNKAS